MKLKRVVTLMSMLSLISCPFAANAAQQHHKHHVAKKHQMSDYKDMGALPVVETCPIIDQYTMMLDGLDQNFGRAKPTEDCMKLISFAGGINFDVKWGNRSMGYTTENNQRISLNDAYLNIYGNVSDWIKAFASISYSNTSTDDEDNTKEGRYSNVYVTSTLPLNSEAAPVSGLDLEQGWIRLSNFDELPFFIQVGKQFQPFGRYRIHPMTRTLAQSLTETLRTSAEVGFLTRLGIHGAVYAFDNPLSHRMGAALASHVLAHASTNYGAELGYDQFNDMLGFSAGIGYLYNMTGVNDVAYAVNDFNGGFGYNNRVSAGTIYADLNSGPFSVGARYVSAIQSFTPVDLRSAGPASSGAKPWAVDVSAGYAFNYWMNRNQNIYAGYQVSGNTVNVFLPRNRWLVGYNIDMWRSTNLGLEWNHDTDYNVAHFGTGNTSNQVTLRAAAKFG